LNSKLLLAFKSSWVEIAIYPVALVFGAFLFPFVVSVYDLIGVDAKWLGSALAVPFAALASSIQKMDDLLNPKGARKIILEWEDYPNYRFVVMLSIGLYGLAIVVMATGYFLVVISKLPVGLLLMLAAFIQSGFTWISVWIASWKGREILGE